MRRFVYWIGVAAAAAAALGIVAYGVVYALSEHILRRTYKIPTAAVPIPTDPVDIVEGRRLALVHGRFNDCHGSQGEGRLMFDQPAIARIVAPNLTSAVRSYSDAQLVAIIREGVRPGGRSVLAMPSETFVTLTDADLGRIIAYMKSLPVTEGAGRSVSAEDCSTTHCRRRQADGGHERGGCTRALSGADHLRVVPWERPAWYG